MGEGEPPAFQRAVGEGDSSDILMAGLEIILLLLLPLAAASGWYVARRRERYGQEGRTLSADYLRGLNHLVNEDADKAIEVFVKLLEVDNETAEVHLALGNLFRRQGEVDRALRIHQNLVARPNLKTQHRNQACYELAQDYLRAGVLDRAESLFTGLAEQGIFQERALAGLVSIYEQGRDWAQAIDTTRKLESVVGHSLRPVIAHYLCELAEVERRRRNTAKAQDYLKQALAEHRDCVRASLLQGAALEAAGEPVQAIEAYQRVTRQAIGFATEILEPLERCYAAAQDLEGWRRFLQSLSERFDGIAPAIAMARLMVREGREQAAIEYLSATLKQRPNWLGFHTLLGLVYPQTQGEPTGALEGLKSSLKRMIEVCARYRCGHCGFDGRNLHWQCPRCKHWNTLTPLPDLVMSTPEPLLPIAAKRKPQAA